MNENGKLVEITCGPNILVVDDEEHIGLYVEILLTREGYNITRCKDGQKAMDLFEADTGFFDLVITDQNMPKMSGAQLSKLLLEIRLDVPIILCTGYGYDNIMDITRDIKIKNYLPKPLKANELLRTVEELLQKDKTNLQYRSAG